MNYRELRTRAQTGDVLLVEGGGLFSKLVRVGTAGSISHVAVLFWLGDALWVAEMRERRGYVITPARLWVQDNAARAHLYYGQAPTLVRADPDAAVDEILHYRNNRYGYLALARVWLGQFVPGYRRTLTQVCSTFAGRVWARCGWEFGRIPTPDQFRRDAVSVWRVLAG